MLEEELEARLVETTGRGEQLAEQTLAVVERDASYHIKRSMTSRSRVERGSRDTRRGGQF